MPLSHSSGPVARNVDAAYAGKLSADVAALRAALREIAESPKVNTAGLAIEFRDIARRALGNQRPFAFQNPRRPR